MSELWDALQRRVAKIDNLPEGVIITDRDRQSWTRTGPFHWCRESDGLVEGSFEMAQVAHMVHYPQERAGQ